MTGTVTKGYSVTAYWWATATEGSGSPSITVFGATLPSELWTKKVKVESVYDGSAWKTHLFIDMSQSEIVTTENIINGDVTTEDLDGSAVTGAKIANYTITSTKYDTASIPALAFTDGTITSDRLVDYTIQTAKIDTDAVTSVAIAADAVGSSEIVALAVGTAELADLAVTTAKIAAVNVTSAELASNSVVTAKIQDSQVTTVKVADDNITPAKLTEEGRTEMLNIYVSFDSSEDGTYRALVPYACTLVEAEARVMRPIAATDSATIQLQNDAGVNMTGGFIDIPASSSHGTGVNVTPSANNVFAAGDYILMIASKTTPGGGVNLSLKFERE